MDEHKNTIMYAKKWYRKQFINNDQKIVFDLQRMNCTNQHFDYIIDTNN